MSYNSLADNLRIWVDDNTAVNIPDASPLTSSVDPSQILSMFSRADGALTADLGTALYGFAGGNGFLTDSKVDAIRETMELRTQRTFTP